MPISIEHALRDAALLLAQHQSPSPKIDASVLLCHVLDKPSSYLYTWSDKLLTDEEEAAFNALLARRKLGEPVAYIIGYRDFWSLRLNVEPSTLIPRPDTERLVELALERLPQGEGTVLDLGTGTGAIALAIASERKDIGVTGVDLRDEAVALAKRNQLANGISNAAFLQSSWFDNVPAQRFTMIVSNPPYIDPEDPHLSQGDVRFEPKSALIADDQGLADIRHICQHSPEYLADGGWLLIEHGYDQGEKARAIFADAGFSDVETVQDYAGQDRVTLGVLR
ncbi:peptide chain release factor N(5)-glutamine methyltransferase [Enterovibrio paralichthyis]|uniref:peptide chain release factor N(5)-glutamine methyltransferase n=1 Tax=Enterovibrio paralichthyis TaxID=2853805 RepID=UPI001C4751A6|nr:peptide chain release factor N(5)-glutamine methyltransferase [Enterovibrio paralichthyis]MBV7300093.1 peptide chain release factor N(5)-glutamine methyltransferase [Enterovibrio paralichthyis]